MKNDNLSNNAIKSYICPWVLPNEPIPIHCIWEEDFNFQKIRIAIPKGFEIEETFNFSEYITEENSVIIEKEKIGKIHDQGFPTFFGLTLLYQEIPVDELKIFREIKIEFYYELEILYTVDLVAKIFRPRLIDKSKIDLINLTDEKKDYKIDLTLETNGFGLISTSLNLVLNKIEFTELENFFEVLKSNLIKKFEPMLDEDTVKEEIEYFIDFLKNLNENQINEEIFDNITKSEFKSKIFLAFISEVIDLLKIKNLSENLILKNPILEISNERLNQKIYEMCVILKYKDKNNNAYFPVEIKIPVKDLRIKPQTTQIKFDIHFKNIINNSFDDIEKINGGESVYG